MGWSLKLGRIFGINIQVHLTFFLILIWGAINFGGGAGPVYGLVVTVALFTLVLLHELGHSVAAKAYGIGVKDITLLPIGGLARLERMPEKPSQELVVALAGPAVNVFLAAILFPIVLWMAGGPASLLLSLRSQPGMAGLLTFLLTANISLAVFNLLPAFPMDGGRVFRALLGVFLDFQRATRLAVIVGRVLAVGLGAFALINGQFFLAMVAVFIFTASGQEGQAVAARGVLRDVRVSQAFSRDTVSLSPSATVGQAAAMVMRGHRSDFAIVDPFSRQLLGVVSSRDVAQAVDRNQWSSPLADIMRPAERLPRVTPNMPLSEVQDRLVEASSRVAAVYDGPFFQGLISAEDVGRVFRFLSRGGSGGRPMWKTP